MFVEDSSWFGLFLSTHMHCNKILVYYLLPNKGEAREERKGNIPGSFKFRDLLITNSHFSSYGTSELPNLAGSEVITSIGPGSNNNYCSCTFSSQMGETKHSKEFGEGPMEIHTILFHSTTTWV